ncbi:MAG: hypothetical protein IJR02_09055 [Bacteroidaceae bacterium]|jgi:hypothetical protein|nr:hypothetical protein [Bacteroidaceae bacterium]
MNEPRINITVMPGAQMNGYVKEQHNYFAPVQQITNEGKPSEESVKATEVPTCLTTEEAERLMKRLVGEGILDENWQPKELSGSEKALVAKAVCERLCVNDVWKVFGKLWNEKPDTLRSYFNKALEQKKSLDFQEKLKKILN